MSSIRIGVLVLNRNGRHWLPPLYDSLRGEGYRNKLVYLLDNASEDDSVELTRRGYPEVTVIRFPANFGYSMAYNLAMAIAWEHGCQWTVWQNNDTAVLPGWLSELLHAALTDERIGVVGPALYAWERDEPSEYMSSANHCAVAPMLAGDRAPVDVPWVEGSSLMVSRRCVAHVGWLDPWLFFYFEEIDFCRRACWHGWRVVLAPQSRARHYGSGWSDQAGANRAGARWLRARNLQLSCLTSPHRLWSANLANFGHLALLLQKDCWWRKRLPQESWTHAKALAWTLAHLPLAWAKWRRDRRRVHGPRLTRKHERILQSWPLTVLPGLGLDDRLPCHIERVFE